MQVSRHPGERALVSGRQNCQVSHPRRCELATPVGLFLGVEKERIFEARLFQRPGRASTSRRPSTIGLERKPPMHSPGRSVSSQLGASADATHQGSSGSVAAAFSSHRWRADCSTCSASSSSSSSSAAAAAAAATSPRQVARRGSCHVRDATENSETRYKIRQSRRGFLVRCALFLLLLCVLLRRETRKNRGEMKLDSTSSPTPPPPP